MFLLLISVKVATNPSCTGINHSVFALYYALEKRNVLMRQQFVLLVVGVDCSITVTVD